jgi:hypothetical protein
LRRAHRFGLQWWARFALPTLRTGLLRSARNDDDQQKIPGASRGFLLFGRESEAGKGLNLS